MDAEVEVRNLFTVKGRGAVAIGYPRQGTARVGQQTAPLAIGTGPLRMLTLAAVEAVRSPDGGADAVGLVFRERPSLDDLRVALAPGTLLRFADPEEFP
jgi:hypothetical protein